MSSDLDARNGDPDFPATLSLASVVKGASDTLRYRLSNWGPGDAPSSVTGIYLSTDNVFGIFSSGVTRVAGSTITDNTTGLVGTLFSRGNNTVEGNGTDGTFTSLFSPK